MKKIFMLIATVALSLSIMKADERPVTFAQLPGPAKEFINTNYPADKVSYATVDDDLIRPDYKVVLVSGTRIQFANNGALEKIESRAGVPVNIVPVQIKDYVRMHYPDAMITEYEIDRRHYEIKLSNRLELKFNKHFNLIEIDD